MSEMQEDLMQRVRHATDGLNQREMQRYHEESQLGELESLAKENGWRGAQDDLTLRGFFWRALESQRAADVVRQQQVQQTIAQGLANAPMQRHAEHCRFSVEGTGVCRLPSGHLGGHEFVRHVQCGIAWTPPAKEES